MFVTIPDVVRLGIVPVDERTVGIAFQVQHVQVAVRIRSVENAIRITVPSEFAWGEGAEGLYFIRHQYVQAFPTKYLCFLSGLAYHAVTRLGE